MVPSALMQLNILNYALESNDMAVTVPWWSSMVLVFTIMAGRVSACAQAGPRASAAAGAPAAWAEPHGALCVCACRLVYFEESSSMGSPTLFFLGALVSLGGLVVVAQEKGRREQMGKDHEKLLKGGEELQLTCCEGGAPATSTEAR